MRENQTVSGNLSSVSKIGGKISSNSIIGRREIEPLLLKAQEVLKSYENSTGIMVSILDQTGNFVGETRYSYMLPFCNICKQCCSNPAQKGNNDGCPCAQIHINGIEEAQKAGGACIYMCEMGFMFWSSPFFSNGRPQGALVAGGILGMEKAYGNIRAMMKGFVPEEETEQFLAGVPARSYEEIKALVQLLLFCAEQVSRGKEDYTEMVTRRAEQESFHSSQIHLLKKKNTRMSDAPGYPLDKERMLFAALRRGDSATGGKILNELLEILYVSSPDNFKFMRSRAIELVVLLSRAAAAPDHSKDENILETNNQYLLRIQEAKNQDELADILHLIVERMSTQIFSFQGVRHASALRKAERFIWENYTRKISLHEIAGASGLSAPYFSSIFKEEMGENLSSYLNRLRTGKAAALLIESDLSLTDIAGICGFEDQSWFSKIFKNYTGLSPGKFREQGEGYVFFSPNNGFEEDSGKARKIG
jgi:AraC-like DNA-binding protein/ligand-binding sensor protein